MKFTIAASSMSYVIARNRGLSTNLPAVNIPATNTVLYSGPPAVSNVSLQPSWLTAAACVSSSRNDEVAAATPPARNGVRLSAFQTPIRPRPRFAGRRPIVRRPSSWRSAATRSGAAAGPAGATAGPVSAAAAEAPGAAASGPATANASARRKARDISAPPPGSLPRPGSRADPGPSTRAQRHVTSRQAGRSASHAARPAAGSAGAPARRRYSPSRRHATTIARTTNIMFRRAKPATPQWTKGCRRRRAGGERVAHAHEERVDRRLRLVLRVAVVGSQIICLAVFFTE